MCGEIRGSCWTVGAVEGGGRQCSSMVEMHELHVQWKKKNLDGFDTM